jgi:prephenate dehydrogenase
MSASDFSAETVAIVGVGLIGGSLGGALRQRKLARRVVGVGRDRERLAMAQWAGLINEFTCDLNAAAAEAALVVVCTPVNRIAAQVRTACETARPGTLVTDAGSVKGAICTALSDLAAGPRVFIGSHPLAGSEKAGFENANPDLFDGRTCVITPLPGHAPGDIARIEQFWQQLGMRVTKMTPEDHDAALARTSHAPHVLAAAIAAALQVEHQPLTATGFRDTTRIASGDPELWTAILLQNAEAVIDALADVESNVSRFRDALCRRDAAALKMLLQTAKTNRDALGNGGRNMEVGSRRLDIGDMEPGQM